MLTLMKSRAARIGALMASAALVLAACGGSGGNTATQTGQAFKDCDASPNTCNSASTDQLQDGGQVAYVIEKNVPNWNVTSAKGNVFETSEVVTRLLPYTFYASPDLNPTLNTDFISSADVTSTNPQTIVYKINPKATWSDGTPINVDDFIYNWKTQNNKDCPDCSVPSTAGYDDIATVVGSDSGKTVTVTMKQPFTDWKTMWSSSGGLYPAHLAAQHGDLNTPAGLKAAFDWFGSTVPTWSGGPWKIDNFQNNVSVTEVPNDKWWGDKPKLSRVIYRIITDATQEPTALQNNEVQAIYPQPQVDMVNQVKKIPNVSSYVGLGLQWEHFDFNLKTPALQNLALRKALFTAVDRQALINKTVGQFTDKVKPLNNHNFMPNQAGYKDVVTPTGQGTGNIDAAKKLLTDAGYKIDNGKLIDPSGAAVPDLRIRYTVGNQIRQNECELFAQAAQQLGVTVKVDPTDDLGDTTTSGDYDIIVFAWVASPFVYAGAIQNWLSTSDSNYGHWVNAQSDALIRQSNAETDVNKAADELNQADQIMSNDAYVLPLYQKPTFLAAYDNIANIRANSTLDGPVYNMEKWGLRKG
ncbi:MAG TPA: ABC transporter family substrate-binding protein [Amycolatopsis sp.]|uniref:ABC transporter family substrate-binding protein n=1 Tax=Amycolatopsis sp. TaxID=37632 RepID=UPI002B45B586|nr:ABC transporter family substrate-binding protein [Amycolatopsis sp.]HKS44736.1 ABC transporter family substrate-binding protein [Amycolatopsis sp.]